MQLKGSLELEDLRHISHCIVGIPRGALWMEDSKALEIHDLVTGYRCRGSEHRHGEDVSPHVRPGIRVSKVYFPALLSVESD